MKIKAVLPDAEQLRADERSCFISIRQVMSEVHKGKTKQDMFDVAFKTIFLPYVLRALSGMH